jgi:hypothetical protein
MVCANGVKDIVAVRQGLRRGAGKRGLAGLAVLGVVGIAGVVAGWGVSPVEPREISATDVVSLRFPDDWNDDGATGSAPEAPAASYTVASAGESQPVEMRSLFSPYQTYQSPAQSALVAVPQMPAAQPGSAPVRTAALPDKASAPKAEQKPAAVAAVHAAAPAAAAPTAAAPAPRARKDSGALFNEAQLVSIKNRLKLSSYQEQYWPAVEAALRAIGWRAKQDAARKGDPRAAQTHAAEMIDPNGAEVQQLKSAAFPLIMSMNDDQKREVRMLAMVMGLERVASSF